MGSLSCAEKEAKIRLQDPKAKKWKEFLGVASGRLQRMKKFVVVESMLEGAGCGVLIGCGLDPSEYRRRSCV